MNGLGIQTSERIDIDGVCTFCGIPLDKSYAHNAFCDTCRTLLITGETQFCCAECHIPLRNPAERGSRRGWGMHIFCDVCSAMYVAIQRLPYFMKLQREEEIEHFRKLKESEDGDDECSEAG